LPSRSVPNALINQAKFPGQGLQDCYRADA
jgi:hypothetical protein